MKYMGSKNRIAKEILPIILNDRKYDQYYVEPFCGGCNLIDKVEGNRIANDSHYYLMAMWNALVNKGWKPPFISRDEYTDIKSNKTVYSPELVGWAGFNCSYSGKYFGGYAGEVNTKGGLRNYQHEASTNTLAQVAKLKGVSFCNFEFDELPIPQNSIIYCDPPYENTTSYVSKFDTSFFWSWVRRISINHAVFVSEYNAPNDFECVWSKDVKSSLSANGKSGFSKNSTEKLFVYKGKI